MKIPPPPVIPPPPPPIFAGAGDKKRDDDLGREISDMLVSMLKITYVPGWQEMLYKFKAAVQPGGSVDVARLPYPASGPNLPAGRPAGSRPALACLYTRLSWIILSYWQIVVHDEGGEEDISYSVKELVELIDHRDDLGNQYHLQQILSRCDVVGNERDGYELEWRGTL